MNALVHYVNSETGEPAFVSLMDIELLPDGGIAGWNLDGDFEIPGESIIEISLH